jgi:hypothetical protein
MPPPLLNDKPDLGAPALPFALINASKVGSIQNQTTFIPLCSMTT